MRHVGLTPKRLASVYAMLREFYPFSAWRLPKKIRFAVIRSTDRFGDYIHDTADGSHTIRASSTLITSLEGLMVLMAHEMVHLTQQIKRTDTDGNDHNADFKRRAKLICKRFGWNSRGF